MVADPVTLQPVPKDGKTIGEIFMRGNLVMKGYLKNPKATAEAFAGGWFHSGDLAVWHPDGYVEIKDRSKDIVISGGENISTVEVEDVLYRHPAVLEAAVVARPDEKWGETPCAFITLKPGAPPVTEEEIIEFCRSQLARFKVPKTVVFGELPRPPPARYRSSSCAIKPKSFKQAIEARSPCMSDTHSNPYELGLDKNAANFTPLTPLTFLERAAAVYPERIATLHGPLRQTWAETYRRCRQLASALQRRGIGLGDTVAIMLPNLPEMFEVHFGVPMSGAVLNTLNIRLDAEMIAFMLQHGEAKLLITDREFSGTIAKALKLLPADSRPVVIDVDDPQFEGGELLGEKNYEALLAEGDPDFAWEFPADEWQAISLNYTSGPPAIPRAWSITTVGPI